MILRLTVFIAILLLPFLGKTQAVNISEGNVFDGEPFMLVNPQNQQHIIIIWMGFDGLELIKIKSRVSFTGGNSWSSPHEFSHITPGFTSADPSMDFDSDGNIYVCFIDYNFAGTAGAVVIFKSVDGGITWSEPVAVIDAFADGSELPIDRPWMVIDRSGGASDGNIYVTTKPAPWIPFPNRNYFIASTNGGLSFEPWRYIDTVGWSIGDFIQAPMASPAVASNGIFYTIYPAWEITENLLPRFILAASENAGGTFNYSEVIESTGGELSTDTSAKLGYLLITNPADVEHLAFLFILQSLGDADIFLLETKNAGNTWSETIRVNDDEINSGQMQDLVWADFDLDGDLLVTWRDRRNAPDTGYLTSSEIYGAIRWKDSVAFSPNFKVSNTLVEFDDVLLGNGNDFMCNVLLNDTIYATWGDTRDGYLNIWFNKISAATLIGTGVQNIATEIRKEIIISPNPSSHFITIEAENMIAVEIYDLAGNRVAYKKISKINSVNVDIKALQSGNYIAIIQNADGKNLSAAFTKN